MLSTTSPSLLETIRGGRDERAWREFFRRYAPMLLAFSRRMGLSENDAHDAVQEAMVAVHKAFMEMPEPFDRSKGRFKAWLRGIAAHKVLDIRRRNARVHRMETSSSDGLDSVDGAACDWDDAFEIEWRRGQLEHCLRLVARDMEPAAYQAFELYALHGQSVAQVSALLGVTRNAVYISKSRVLQRVRAVLNEMQSEDE